MVVQWEEKARFAQTYPIELFRAICRGIAKQKQMDSRGPFTFMNHDDICQMEMEEAENSFNSLHERERERGMDASLGRRHCHGIRPEIC